MTKSKKVLRHRSLMLYDIIIGLLVTLKYLFMPKVTINYPHEKNKISLRFRGEHFLHLNEKGENKCTACNLCVKVCPIKAIKLTSKVVDKKLVPDVYDIDIGRCIYCGLCKEICPVNAIDQCGNFELATLNKNDLVYSKEKLLYNGSMHGKT